MHPNVHRYVQSVMYNYKIGIKYICQKMRSLQERTSGCVIVLFLFCLCTNKYNLFFAVPPKYCIQCNCKSWKWSGREFYFTIWATTWFQIRQKQQWGCCYCARGENTQRFYININIIPTDIHIYKLNGKCG